MIISIVPFKNYILLQRHLGKDNRKICTTSVVDLQKNRFLRRVKSKRFLIETGEELLIGICKSKCLAMAGDGLSQSEKCFTKSILFFSSKNYFTEILTKTYKII